MRVTIAAVALVALVFTAGLVAQRPERAAADYNISGEWIFDFGGGPCPGTMSLTLGVPPNDDVAGVVTCSPPFPITLTGTLNTSTRALTLSGTFDEPSGLVAMQGTVSLDGHTMTGTWMSNYSPYSGNFTATGGSGDAKPGQPTHTPTATATATRPATPTRTPHAVGGVALDPSSNGGNPFDAWWLASIAGAAAAMLGGAATLARRRPI